MSYTITRRLESTYDALSEEFKGLYCVNDFQYALDAMNRAGNAYWLQNEGILLDMFDQCGLRVESGKKNDTKYYRQIVEGFRAEGRILTRDEVSEKLMQICERMLEKYKDYPTAPEYLKRIVDTQEKAAGDPWGNDSLRLRILKRFVKYGNYAMPILDKGSPRKRIKEYVAAKLQKDKPSEEEILANLDDDIFTAVKDCDLLLTCDALATGRFRTNGATKRDLYLFAVIYDMTYFSYTQEGAVINRDTDVATRLFRDYYMVNLLQYALRKQQGISSTDEIDPSNCSINYRNFAEMICLYYLCQNISAKEKIKGIADMIKQVKTTEQSENLSVLPDQQAGATVEMRRQVMGEENMAGAMDAVDIMALPEDEFKAFIQRNYDCCAKIGKRDVSPFEVNDTSRTAAAEFARIMTALKKDKYFNVLKLGDGLYFKAEEHYSQEYQAVLAWVEKMLHDCLADKAEADVNRTKLLAACYYQYIRDIYAYWKEVDTEHGRSFHEHFQNFCSEANPVLERANFAPVSSRNLLDLLLVVSAYAYAYD